MSYARYLRFLSDNHPDLLTELPKGRLDRRLIAEHVGLLRKTNQDISIATSLHHLRLALKLIGPKEDWSWLSTIAKRITGHGHDHPHEHDEAHTLATSAGPVTLEILEDGVPPRFRLSFAAATPTADTVSLETVRADGARQLFYNQLSH